MTTILKDRLELLDTIGLKDKVCAEIGVFKGEFADEIMKREPGALILIDPWKNYDPRDYHDINNHGQDEFDKIYESVVERYKSDERVKIIRQDSYSAFTKELCNDIKFLDFVYIDGNHGFAYVLADLLLWSTQIRPGGWLCGHDYKSPFVGVQMAVDAFCQITGNSVEYETADAPWKSFAIRIKE